MDNDLRLLHMKVQDQGARVYDLERQMHNLVEKLHNERHTLAELQRQLKGKQDGN